MLASLLPIVLSTPALLLGLYLVGPPVLIRFVMKMDTRDAVRAVDEEELPQDAFRGFEEREAAAMRLGYVPVGRFEVDMVEDVSMWTSVLARPGDPAALLFAFTQPTAPAGGSSNWSAEFASETRDGREFDTTNAVDAASVDQNPHKTTWVLPGRTVAELRAAHRDLTAALSPAPRWKPLPLELSFEEWMRRQFLDEMSEKAQRGFWRESDGVFRPTWKGAFLSTWSQLPPMNGLRNARILRRAEADLAAARSTGRATVPS